MLHERLMHSFIQTALIPASLTVFAAEVAAQDRVREESLAVVLLRALPTLSESHSVGVIDLDPESPEFGKLLAEFEQPELDHPLHHLYYGPNGRLYATGLDPKCSLAEINLDRTSVVPGITGVSCLDTAGQMVGEDIIWHTVDGQEFMYVTFMGGRGEPDGGTIGVFDPETNAVVAVIEARKSEVGEGEPYILYPHGLSAYGDRMVVTSTVHPDLATGVGNTVTVIDLSRNEAIETITVEDAKPVGFPSSPVEVLFTRPALHPDARPGVLVNTMFGFEVWQIPYDETGKSFGEPKVVYSGVENDTAVPLEFYGTEEELFISHALPGVVKRYDASKLPDLVSSGPDIVAEKGAHHVIFFTSASGRELIAVQNNLLNLGNAEDNDPTDVDFIAGLNANTVTIHDLGTGEQIAKVDFRGAFGKGVDNFESVGGEGFAFHH